MRIFSTIAEALAHTTPRARRRLGRDPVQHVLSRLAFGPGPTSRAQVERLGIPSWYGEQVALGVRHRGYSGDPAVAAEGSMLHLSPAAVMAAGKGTAHLLAYVPMDQLARVTLGLQVWSAAQLYETLVDLFANHLNVANHLVDLWATRAAYDREVIRRHAMGSFTEMLLASARHPAMLQYLDLATSTKKAVNENYGRELLELHTVGPELSEADVRNASRILTGRGVDKLFEYAYVPANHWTGRIRVLGFTHPNSSPADGEAGADAMIRHLAAHPSTARRLAAKMCMRYVSDSPSASLVSAVAKAYRASGTYILPMLSVIVRSDEFWASQAAKVRRPAENLVATMRVLDARPANTGRALVVLHRLAAELGHVPLDAVPPTGYPDVAAAWRSSGTLVRTWRHHLGLAANHWPDAFVRNDRTALYGGTPATSGEALARLGRRLTGGALAPAQLSALQEFLDEPETTPMADSALRTLLPQAVALILNGPQHALR